MQEEELAMKQEEESQYLNQRINEISEKEAKVLAKEARMIAEFVENKIKILKTYYDQSDSTVKEKIHGLIRYPQLRCFLTGKMFTDSNRSRKVTLKDDIIYSEKAVKIHINKGTPKTHKKRALEFYSFYFGRYRLLFRCFGRDFLENENLDKEFIDDVFSPKEGDFYVSVERLEIAGATIIDEEFIEDIKTRNFSMAEFFTAKQNKYTQWYGIINGWDIRRDIYEEVKSIIGSSFEEEKNYKVAGVIFGEGGSGKSTVIRRLAKEISSEKPFKVLWLESFDIFTNKQQDNLVSGLEIIKNDFSQNYVLFIEDWHSQVDYYGITEANKFLKQTQTIKNIRIVIGDRDIHGKEYCYNLYDQNNKFLLNASENKEIIYRVVAKVPEWKTDHLQQILAGNLDNTPLFMLLFIIAKVSENKDLSNLDLSEPHTAFIEIIRDDLEKLKKLKCLGMAKVLYYWSCIYSEFGILISYKTLLVLAKHFNRKKDKNPKEYENLHLSGQITQILNTYIGTRVHNEKYNHQVFYFNHDILSDDGLRKVSFKDWDNYDDVILKMILDILIAKGNEVSASFFLQCMIRFKPNLFENKEEQLKYINLLIDRKVRHYSYVSPLVNSIILSLDELDAFAEKLWKIGNYNNIFWSYVLSRKKLEEKWGEIILSNFDLQNFSSEMVKLALNSYQYKTKHELVQQVCRKILEADILEINLDIIHTALKICKDDDLVQKTCNIVLGADILNISPIIVSGVLRLCKDDDLVQKACNIVLGADILNISPIIVSDVLRLCKDDDLVQKACNIILGADALNISTQLITAALKLYKDDNLIQRTCKIILKGNIVKMSPDIVSSSLKLCKDDDLVQKACKILLEANEFNFHKDIIPIALKLCTNDDLIQNTYKKILKNDISKISHEIVSIALTNCTDDCLTQNVYKMVLEDDILNIPYQIVSIALKNCTDNSLVQNACKILLQNDILNLRPVIIYIAFKYLDDDKLKKEIAQSFLEKFLYNSKYFLIVYQLLLFYTSFRRVPIFIEEIVSNIILNTIHSKNTEEQEFFLYQNILKIPFHSLPIWKEHTLFIIKNWGKYPRINIYYILLAYKNEHSNEITSVCEEILTQWQKEIYEEFPLFQKGSLRPFHLILSMGHPNLRYKSIQIAEKINYTVVSKGLSIPHYVKKIIDDIVYNKIFPTWIQTENFNKNI